MALEFNSYAAIFNKLKDLFERDSRTSYLKFYGSEYAKKKTLPCVLIFPESKNWIDDPGTRDYRKVGIPKQVHYTFNLWGYNSLTEVDDSYYSIDNGPNAGITQIFSDVESVLIDNKQGFDLITTTRKLWSDMSFENVEISQRPGKLIFGKLQVKFVSKEIS